jgi:Na+-driven multidrug efflux pump
MYLAAYCGVICKKEFRMDINATILGQFIFISMIIITGLSYYLGKRKTQNVKTTTFVGFLLSFIPPLGLIFVAVLVLKNDVASNV